MLPAILSTALSHPVAVYFGIWRHWKPSHDLDVNTAQSFDPCQQSAGSRRVFGYRRCHNFRL